MTRSRLITLIIKTCRFNLQRHVIQVGWAEPFERWQDDFADHASDDQGFWKKWDGPRRLFVVTDKATYNNLRREKQRINHLVAQSEYSVVISNQTRRATVVN